MAPRTTRFAALLTAGLMLAAPAGAAAADADNGDAGAEGNGAGMSVDQAWENAKRDWQKLQDASGEAWGEAKREFEDSWSRLQQALSDSDEAAPPPDPAVSPDASGDDGTQ
jgi:hypothetical protein